MEWESLENKGQAGRLERWRLEKWRVIGRRKGNGVGKPGEQGTSREIGGTEARIEEDNEEKGGECSRKPGEQGTSREIGGIEPRIEERNGEKGRE
jgi:hypothetical protein